MSIAPIGNLQMMPFSGNVLQNFGTLAFTAFIVNAVANIPLTAARDTSGIAQEICKIICTPLPGDQKDAPESICQEICKLGDTVTKIREIIDGKVGPWMDALPEKVILPGIDCANVCNPIYGVGRLVINGGQALFAKDLTAGLSSAAMGGCTALLGMDIYAPTGAGYGSCLSCCAALKITGNG